MQSHRRWAILAATFSLTATLCLPNVSSRPALSQNTSKDKSADTVGKTGPYNSRFLQSYDLAKELTGRGKYKEATRAVDQAINLEPQNAKAYALKALIKAQHGYPEEAFALADKALRFDPKCAEAYVAKGSACYFTDKQKEGFAVLKKALELNPNVEDGNHFLAIGYGETKQFDKALIYMDKAIAQKPKELVLYKQRMLIYQNLNRPQDAIKDINTILKLKPNDKAYYASRAEIYDHMGNTKAALADLETAIKLQPNWARSYFIKAQIHAKLGNHKAAAEDYGHILALNSLDDDCLVFRGREYLAAKDYTKALADFNAAIESSPREARAAYEGRAKVYEATGKSALAAKDREQAKKIMARPAEGHLYEK